MQIQLAQPFAGIPVPGQTVSALKTFRMLDNSCMNRRDSKRVASSLAVLGECEELFSLKSFLFLFSGTSAAEQFARKIYNSLYFAIAEVRTESLVGRWYTMAASPSLKRDHCVMSKGSHDVLTKEAHKNASVQTTSASKYLNQLSVTTHYRGGDGVLTFDEGYITKMGPDAGHILVQLGNVAESCPCWFCVQKHIRNTFAYRYCCEDRTSRCRWTVRVHYPHSST